MIRGTFISRPAGRCRGFVLHLTAISLALLFAGTRAGAQSDPLPSWNAGPAKQARHTDGEREFAYDRKSSIGRLDKALDEANARGWTVVDMKTNWNAIFPFSSQKNEKS